MLYLDFYSSETVKCNIHDKYFAEILNIVSRFPLPSESKFKIEVIFLILRSQNKIFSHCTNNIYDSLVPNQSRRGEEGVFSQMSEPKTPSKTPPQILTSISVGFRGWNFLYMLQLPSPERIHFYVGTTSRLYKISNVRSNFFSQESNLLSKRNNVENFRSVNISALASFPEICLSNAPGRRSISRFSIAQNFRHARISTTYDALSWFSRTDLTTRRRETAFLGAGARNRNPMCYCLRTLFSNDFQFFFFEWERYFFRRDVLKRIWRMASAL